MQKNLPSNLYCKKILLGITGGIAAFKCAELIRLLQKNNAEVKVIITKNGQQFITPLTLQTLSKNKVYTDMFDLNFEPNIDHIELARWADLVLVAPASANFIANITYGLAPDLLTTTCLATTAPIAIAPAMNHQMWNAKITQQNLATLKKRGINIFGPTSGIQACGEIGSGRMLEPNEILALTDNFFAQKAILKNCNILITAGPTIEPIDPVRFISNYSSGKMGYTLAQRAMQLGANVTLISGPTSLCIPTNVNYIAINTAVEMQKAVMANIAKNDIFIAAAAVADYRVENIASNKIKKSADLTLKLIKNLDILSEVTKLKYNTFIVGFAAETENLLENAKQKLIQKNLDMIIVNKVGFDENQQPIGFMNDANEIIILSKNGDKIAIPKCSKQELAKKIMEIIMDAQNF